ncbi:MAG TPA: SelB C-terminal domain-containing protein [Streptosporangiaceae bacterium]
MQVIATAGHVDHGKSALVRALTGMEPDRWAEERRRGLTIDLGFAWLTLPGGEPLAFVDVPGHERFVPNMLAGLGPVPAVLFVVAADGGWMPQSAEHLAAIDALGITRGLLAVTRSDLADPGPAMRRAQEEIGRTSLGEVPAVAVSARTGQGLPGLRAALARLAAALPAPDPGAPVRLWVDRAFTVTGSGTVVTGTLPAGTLHTGDELLLVPSGRPVRVRGIESLKEKASQVCGVARVAVNLRGGTSATRPARGTALVTPDGWALTTVADVRLAAPPGPLPGSMVPGSMVPGGAVPGSTALDQPPRLPRQVTVHIGSARVLARVRPFGSRHARLTMASPLPLHVGDRLLLRDPGAARDQGSVAAAAGAGQRAAEAGMGTWTGGEGRLAITGAVVLDVSPPATPRRRAAAAVARELDAWPGQPGAVHLLRRHGLVTAAALRAMGVPVPEVPPTGADSRPAGADRRPPGTAPAGPPGAVAGPPEAPVAVAGWLADSAHWARLRERLGREVAAHAAREPLAVGMPLAAAQAAAGLPDRRLAVALAAVPGDPPLMLRDGYLAVDRGPAATPGPATHSRSAESGTGGQALPAQVTAAVQAVREALTASPFRAPEAGRLAELGLDRRALAAAERAGLLLRIGPGIVLAPGADAQAVRILAGLPQPFSTAQARQALDTTRRVAIPLLEHLDRSGMTRRLPDDRRMIRTGQGMA